MGGQELLKLQQRKKILLKFCYWAVMAVEYFNTKDLELKQTEMYVEGGRQSSIRIRAERGCG